jgi:predicted PhzF superfamily epimerase YddE/YHI9
MRIRIVDAFTDQPFSGAPAGVVVLDAFPDDGWMQRVAAEVNHAETAFLHPITSNTEIAEKSKTHPPVSDAGGRAAAGGGAAVPAGDEASLMRAAGGAAGLADSEASLAVAGDGPVGDGLAGGMAGGAASGGPVGDGLAGGDVASSGGVGTADWALRWFTPTVEVALCGHATLAAAHVLTALGGAGALTAGRTVRFATKSGILTATAGADGLITLDFPTAPLSPVAIEPALVAALGVPVVAVHHTGPDTDDLLVEVADETAVRTVDPDLRALTPLSRRGVIVTARADGSAGGSAGDGGPVGDGGPADGSAGGGGINGGSEGGYDFVTRFFGPAVGVDEDPVTGSAHTALAPYWSARLGRDELTGYQASRRGGFVRVALRGDRTLLSGKAVTVIDGTLNAQPAVA